MRTIAVFSDRMHVNRPEIVFERKLLSLIAFSPSLGRLVWAAHRRRFLVLLRSTNSIILLQVSVYVRVSESF